MLTTWQTKVIALTGSIASGKSTAASMLEGLGAYVVRADDLAREAVRPGSPALEEIRAEFGDQYIQNDGTLDRAKLGSLVFSNQDMRSKLNSIVHPKVGTIAEERFTTSEALHAPLRIYEVPLFYENGMDNDGFAAAVVVHAEEAALVDRITSRDSLSPTEAEQRLKAQLPISEKTAKADYVISNNGSLEDLSRQISQLFDKLRS